MAGPVEEAGQPRRIHHLWRDFHRVLVQVRANIVHAAKQKHPLGVQRVQRFVSSGCVLLLTEYQLLRPEAPVPGSEFGIVGFLPIDAGTQDQRVPATPVVRVPALRLRLVVLGGGECDQIAAIPIEPAVK
jgi:hypothetical protein